MPVAEVGLLQAGSCVFPFPKLFNSCSIICVACSVQVRKIWTVKSVSSVAHCHLILVGRRERHGRSWSF